MIAVILDCHVAEPAGNGVAPYLGTYARYAYASLVHSKQFSKISYLTIDDFRASRGSGQGELTKKGLSDPFTYSRTKNFSKSLELLRSCDLAIVIVGDTVPTVHLHARKGTLEEAQTALAELKPGAKKILLGPLAASLSRPDHPWHTLFDAFHTQTIPPDNILGSTDSPLPYSALHSILKVGFKGLTEQIPWKIVAEIDTYRGCTRKDYCSFCFEPVKNHTVVFREPEHIVDEVKRLYEAGVRNFRLGQQTCFFSYFNRDVGKIHALLEGIRRRCPEIDVLHIDNVDPLAAASQNGRRIARLVADYCTEGNCAAMGIETFDSEVVSANRLTCTPDVALKAIENINEFGSAFGPLGQRKLLVGINLIYGLPRETRRTHLINMNWLFKILDDGYHCHRTNVRQAEVYPGTPLSELVTLKRRGSQDSESSNGDFQYRLRDIEELFMIPMKIRVYPENSVMKNMYAYFKNEQGTWFRRLGSYPIQVIDSTGTFDLYETRDIRVTRHAGRFLFGEARV